MKYFCHIPDLSSKNLPKIVDIGKQTKSKTWLAIRFVA